MRILVIGRSFPEQKTGMMGIFEFEQAVALHKAGHEVSYIYSDVRSIKYQRKFSHKNLLTEGVNVNGYHLPIGGIPQKILQSIRRKYLLKALVDSIQAAGKPDIVHIHFPLIVLDDEIWNYICKIGCKIVITEHWTHVQAGILNGLEISLLKKVAQRADWIICVSDELKQSIFDYVGKSVLEKKISVIPNMVEEKFQYQKKLDNGSAFTFMFAGRLEKHKGCDILIDAFEKAFPKSDKKVRLLILGKGNEYKRLVSQANSYNDNRIVFKGFVDRKHLVSYYRVCDVYVSASILETFGVPFIEAWCCGRPVICVEGQPINKYLLESANGSSVHERDVDDLAEKLKKSRDYGFSMSSKEISEWAFRHFSQNAVISHVNEIYENLFRG